MKLNPTGIYGSCWSGVALDWHTLSSVPRSDGGFDTTRSELGEALYQLKYRLDRSKIEPLATVVAEYIKKSKIYTDLKAIIAVPPSKDRSFQPVLQLANAIGMKTSLSVPKDYLLKVKKTSSLKDVEDVNLRKQELQGAFRVIDQRYAGKTLLVFDDLYRSGETLNAVCNVLQEYGNVNTIYTLTITRTRIKR
ncbi:MAG: ComF family protein [Cyanobacteria bacterium J149]|nr:MAG: ComF family protein [Cyanobacteria bacterium J149]